jgi:hypothetical protein
MARSAVLAVGLVLAAGAVAASEPSASAGASVGLEPAASPAASPMGPHAASPATQPSPPAGYLPLPAQVAVIPADVPTVSVPAESGPGALVVGTPIAYTLGHCGLWSPVDLDGSVWQPVGGTDASGGSIDSDAEIGELINATPGEFMLLTPDTAEFRTATGVVVAFARAPGELDYPLCM